MFCNLWEMFDLIFKLMNEKDIPFGNILNSAGFKEMNKAAIVILLVNMKFCFAYSFNKCEILKIEFE